jgi:hypothetical protein
MIREEAARKLARRLLEPRITRVTPLTDQFIDAVAKMIMTYVSGDEQKQRMEAGAAPLPEEPKE